MGLGQSIDQTLFCCDTEGEEYEDETVFEWWVPGERIMHAEKGTKLDSNLFKLKNGPPLKLRFFPRGFRMSDDGNCSLYVWAGGSVTMQLRVSVNGFARMVPEEGPETWDNCDCKGFHNFCPWPPEDVKLRVELLEPAEESFEVILDKTRATKYGMQTSDGGDMIRIHSVRPGGLIARWNATHPPQLHIMGGDCIIEANGIGGDSNVLKSEMLMDRRQRLVIKRTRQSRNSNMALALPPALTPGTEVTTLALPTKENTNGYSNDRTSGNGCVDPGPISSSVPRPALAKMNTAEFREVRERARSGVSGIRYLPTHIKNVQVLVNIGLNRWCAENAGQANLTDGVAYRYSKNIKHIVEDSFLRWGESIKAFDEGDGWVKFSLSEEEFEVEIDKEPGQVLGIDTMRSDTGEIYIQRVNQTGLLAAWNQNNPAYKVHAGDCIVGVNGVKGHSGRMMNKLKSKQTNETLKLTIRRPTGFYQLPQMENTGNTPEIQCEVDQHVIVPNAPVSKSGKSRRP